MHIESGLRLVNIELNVHSRRRRNDHVDCVSESCKIPKSALQIKIAPHKWSEK